MYRNEFSPSVSARRSERLQVESRIWLPVKATVARRSATIAARRSATRSTMLRVFLFRRRSRPSAGKEHALELDVLARGPPALRSSPVPTLIVCHCSDIVLEAKAKLLTEFGPTRCEDLPLRESPQHRGRARGRFLARPRLLGAQGRAPAGSPIRSSSSSPPCSGLRRRTSARSSISSSGRPRRSPTSARATSSYRRSSSSSRRAALPACPVCNAAIELDYLALPRLRDDAPPAVRDVQSAARASLADVPVLRDVRSS